MAEAEAGSCHSGRLYQESGKRQTGRISTEQTMTTNRINAINKNVNISRSQVSARAADISRDIMC